MSWLQEFYIVTFTFLHATFLLQLLSSRPIAQNVPVLIKKSML